MIPLIWTAEQLADPPDWESGIEVIEEPRPEVCPECWNTEKVDPDRAMEAVRSLSKGTK